MAEENVVIRFKAEDDASATAQKVADSVTNIGNAADAAGGRMSGMGNFMSGILQGVGQSLGNFAIQLGSQAIGAVTDFVSGSITEAAEWESAMAQTRAVIESTGSAAGLTAEQFAQMATDLSASGGMSIFSDDAILGAQNVLATFTNIKGENFSGATQSIVDMSQALGMDLQSAAMQVGKALNDPEKGLSALARAGVTFSAEQENVIKQMVATGDVAGAQKLMLDELGRQFGGSAAAAVDTYAGQQVVLQEKMAGIQQTLGEALMPLMLQFGAFMSNTLVPILATVVTAISAWITQTEESNTLPAIFDAIRGAIAAVPVIIAQVGSALQMLATWAQPVTDAFMGLVNTIVPALGMLGNAIMTVFASPAYQAAMAAMIGAFGALANLLRDVLVLAFNASAAAWTILVQGFQIAWPYIQTVLSNFYTYVGIVFAFAKGIFEALSLLIQGDFSGAWKKYSETVETAIGSVVKFIGTLKTDITTFLNEILGKFGEVGTNIATGIANGISSAAGKIKDAALSAVSSAYEAAKDWLGVESPSKLMHNMIGVNFSRGIATGIMAGVPEVTTAGRIAASAAASSTVQNYYNFSASYSRTQSESSLVSDTRAMLMMIGAS